MGITPEETEQLREKLLAQDRRANPGLVRLSFGLYNTEEEIDRFVEAIEKIVQREYLGRYFQDPSSGEYHPKNWKPILEGYYHF